LNKEISKLEINPEFLSEVQMNELERQIEAAKSVLVDICAAPVQAEFNSILQVCFFAFRPREKKTRDF